MDGDKACPFGSRGFEFELKPPGCGQEDGQEAHHRMGGLDQVFGFEFEAGMGVGE